MAAPYAGNVVKEVIKGIAAFCVLGTALPLFRSRHWAVRAFDFPRLQLGSVAAFCAGVGLANFRRLSKAERRLLGLTIGAVAGQSIQIIPYTRAGRKEVKTVEGPADFRVLTANVLQFNRQSRTLARQIQENEPDVILITEADDWWRRELAWLRETYPNQVEQAQENTYGMCLYSRLELLGPEVRFLVKDEIPSIRTRVRLKNGRTMWLYAVHPEPPASAKRNGELRGSGPRDVELMVLAEELKSRREPVVVVGDFNDVAWSHTTRLFKRLSRLLDPRRGRGMFNTYHAWHWTLRYPLDHLFHSDHWGLVEFRRLGCTGSDHFPILAALKLAPGASEEQEQEGTKQRDLKEAHEVVREADVE